jgi:hypothetical protein
VSVPRSPTPRLLIALACLDALFAVVIGYTYFVMLGIEGDSTRTAVAVLAGLWVVKVITWMTILSIRLRPLGRWFDGGTPPADPDDILEVAGAAYRVPFAVSVTWAVAFGGTCMLHVLVLYVWFPDVVPLGPHSLEGALFSSIGVVLGAVVMTFTLAEWLMAPLLESVSLTAQERGITLRGRGLTYRARLVVFALMLALGPTFYLAGITYMNAAGAEQRELALRAEIAAAEAALGRGAAARRVDGWLLKREITISAALLAAAGFVAMSAAGVPPLGAGAIGALAGFVLRAGAIHYGWALPAFGAKRGERET